MNPMTSESGSAPLAPPGAEDPGWRSRLSMRIYGHLVAFLFLVTIPVWIVLIQGEQLLVDQARQGALRLSRAVSGHVESSLERGRRAAKNLLVELGSPGADRARSRELLARFLTYSDLYSNAYWFDTSGNLLSFHYAVGQPSTSVREGQSLRDGDPRFATHALEALRTLETKLTPTFTTTSGRKQLTQLVPGPQGLLSLAIYSLQDRVNSCLAGLDMGATGSVMVLDGEGGVIASTGRSLPPEKLTRMLADPASREPGAILDDPAGDELTAIARIHSSDLRVIVSYAKQEVLAGVARFRVLSNIVVLALLGLALVLGWRLSRSILGPLGALLDGIRRVHAGALDHRIPSQGGDEIDVTARAFNQLADQLYRERLIEDVWREIRRA